jgi:hypothetical protein
LCGSSARRRSVTVLFASSEWASVTSTRRDRFDGSFLTSTTTKPIASFVPASRRWVPFRSSLRLASRLPLLAAYDTPPFVTPETTPNASFQHFCASASCLRLLTAWLRKTANADRLSRHPWLTDDCHPWHFPQSMAKRPCFAKFQPS